MNDVSSLLKRVKSRHVPKEALLKGRDGLKYETARVLANLEKENSKLTNMLDQEVQILQDHDDDTLQVHLEKAEVPGIYHLGVYVEGTYCPEHTHSQGNHVHNHKHDHGHNTHSTEQSSWS
jgi:hypothetical protein